MKNPLSILVVCSDPTFRHVYSKQLELVGADVTAAANVEQAMTAAYENRFDRILCTQNIGNVAGAEVLRRLAFVAPGAETVLLGHDESGSARAIAVPFDYAALKALARKRPSDEPEVRDTEEQVA